MRKCVWLSMLLTVVLCASAAEPKPVRVACVGDSITAGGGTSPENSYPAQLGRMLGAGWEVKNFGVGGAALLNHGDLPYQKQSAHELALEFQPNIVVIMLGSNDSKPQNWRFKDEFIADFEDLINQFAKLPSRPRIFICRPPIVPGIGNYGVNEKGVLEEIPMIDKIAGAEKARVIDMHAALQNHPELLPDRAHPNDAGATILAQTVYRALTGKEFTGPAPLAK